MAKRTFPTACSVWGIGVVPSAYQTNCVKCVSLQLQRVQLPTLSMTNTDICWVRWSCEQALPSGLDWKGHFKRFKWMPHSPIHTHMHQRRWKFFLVVRYLFQNCIVCPSVPLFLIMGMHLHCCILLWIRASAKCLKCNVIYFPHTDRQGGEAKASGGGAAAVGGPLGVHCEWFCLHEEAWGRDEGHKW